MDKEKIIKGCENWVNTHKGENYLLTYSSVVELLALLKEQEAEYGYWINPTSQDCHCSECGNQPEHEPGGSVPLYDFCPYCGAKMEVKWNG